MPWRTQLTRLGLSLALPLSLACSAQNPTQLDDSPREVAVRNIATGPKRRPLAPAVVPGPVAEFAPLRAVATHTQADDMAKQLNPTLRRLLPDRHTVVQHRWDATPAANPPNHDNDGSAVWLRDYQPIFVRQDDGSLHALYYLSANANRSSHRMPSLSSIPGSVLPIIHENGNLISMGSRIFFSEALIDDNALFNTESHLLEAGYRPRSERELLRLLSLRLRRPVEDMIIMPRMPFEGTGHVDTYLLPLDEETIAIPSIEDDGLALVNRETPAYHMALVVRTFLNEQAEHLHSLGLRVVRLPMLPPAQTQTADTVDGASDDEPEDHQSDDVLVFTPANTLLVNTGQQRLAFVPSFAGVSDDQATIAVLARYEERWGRQFRRAGWTPHFVGASELVGYLGLIRCLSASIPR